MNALYDENDWTLMKLSDGKVEDIPCSWIGRIDIIKMSTLLKESADATHSLSKYCWLSFKNQKGHREWQKTQSGQCDPQ